MAWYGANSGGETHSVGQKKPNGFGLYDMSGNVYEWVWDWHGDNSSTDLVGLNSGKYRVFRGGSWNYNARSSRVSNREIWYPGNERNFRGFRPGRTP